MSRLLMFMTLAILAVLLAVMSYVIAPKPPAAQDPRAQMDPKKMEEMQKQEMARRQAQMTKEMDARKNAAKQQAAMSVKKPPKAGMVIESDWFRKRPDGEAGISQMQKEAAENAKVTAQPRVMAAPPPGASGQIK